MVIPFLAVTYNILYKHCSRGKENAVGEFVSFRWRERRQFDTPHEDIDIVNNLCPMCRAPMGELRTAFIAAECMICFEQVPRILITECGHSICNTCAPSVHNQTLSDGWSGQPSRETRDPNILQPPQYLDSKDVDVGSKESRCSSTHKKRECLSQSQSAVANRIFSER